MAPEPQQPVTAQPVELTPPAEALQDYFVNAELTPPPGPAPEPAEAPAEVPQLQPVTLTPPPPEPVEEPPPPAAEATPVVEPTPVVEAPPVETSPAVETPPVELPVLDLAPPAPEPVAEELPALELAPPAAPDAELPEPVVDPQPQRHDRFRVVVRLSEGDGVEVGEFRDFGTAMEGAQEVIEQFSNANGSWPFYAGRFIRPDLIVSVDVVGA
jgi:hypothetical protein